jgi:hypothetical protein
MNVEPRQVLVLRIAAPPGAAGIRALRALMKTLLKRHKFRALDVREEHQFKPQNADTAQPNTTTSKTAAIGGSVSREFDDSILFGPEVR